MAAENIHNLVRGLTRPYVGAHFDYREQPIKVWKIAIVAEAPAHIEPGKVLSVDEDGVLIKAGSGAVRLLDYTPRLSFRLGEYL